MDPAAQTNNGDYPSQVKIDRELDNQVALSGDLRTRALVWQSRPTTLEFSFNNVCNLKCIMCAKSDGEPNWLLDKENGKEFLQDALPFVLDWTPSANSEPLLNDLELIAGLAHQHHVYLHVISNCMLLTRERFDILRPRMHKLWISLDSAKKETFETIRTPAKWDTVMANIREILPVAHEDHIEVTFNFVLMSANWSEAADYVRLVADLGGKVCNIQELLPNSTRFEELRWEPKVPIEEIQRVLAEAEQVAKERQIDLKIELRPPLQSQACYHPFEHDHRAPLADLRMLYGKAANRANPGFCQMAAHYMKVTPDGSVYPCCRGPAELKMGDIKTQTYDEIWNGEKYQELRRKMFEQDYPDVCKNCYILVGNPEYQKLQAEKQSREASPSS